MERMGKIVFYEDKNFEGRYYECGTDCPELNTHFRRCNSVRVENGAWVLYERPNYLGYQYVLTRGEYPDYQRWLGYNDSIRSCRMIRNLSGVFRVHVYECPEFSGQMLECIEDINNLPDRWNLREIHSAQVHDGAWVFFELPNYRGGQYLLEKGEFCRFTDWGAMNPNVGSIRRVYDS
ncbi:gamma-crystallin M2-like [Melanotaenia boesemani]|uniref:gamma-crystallin M2-like n=1 Tax=Melanotaenia boesemani TaxID=1250792 RepID=UPI001C0494E8|nr:gamma-crystallin M2-like [Melanotaenia boesemani]